LEFVNYETDAIKRTGSVLWIIDSDLEQKEVVIHLPLWQHGS